MERVRRPNFCAGAITYDSALRERRIKCDKETGDPLVRLCAGCRVIEKLEDNKRRKAVLGEEQPVSRHRYRRTEPEEERHSTPPPFPRRNVG